MQGMKSAFSGGGHAHHEQRLEASTCYIRYARAHYDNGGPVLQRPVSSSAHKRFQLLPMRWRAIAFGPFEGDTIVNCCDFLLVLNAPPNAGRKVFRSPCCSTAVAEQKAQEKHVVDGHLWSSNKAGSISLRKSVAASSAQKGDFISQQAQLLRENEMGAGHNRCTSTKKHGEICKRKGWIACERMRIARGLHLRVLQGL